MLLLCRPETLQGDPKTDYHKPLAEARAIYPLSRVKKSPIKGQNSDFSDKTIGSSSNVAGTAVGEGDEDGKEETITVEPRQLQQQQQQGGDGVDKLTNTNTGDDDVDIS